MGKTTVRNNPPVHKRALARPVRTAIVVLMGIVIPTCGPKVESERSGANLGDATKATAIQTNVRFAGMVDGNGIDQAKSISYSIACPSRQAGSRGQSFPVGTFTTSFMTTFKDATEDYESCDVDLSSLRIETSDSVCQLDPSGGIRTIDLPVNATADQAGSAPAGSNRAVVAIHLCEPRNTALTPVRRYFTIRKDFPQARLSTMLKEPQVEIAIEEIRAPSSPNTNPGVTGPAIPTPILSLDHYPFQPSAPKGMTDESGVTAGASMSIKCVDMAAAGLNVNAASLPPSDIQVQRRNPWCTPVALRHSFAAVINCSNLNAPSSTNIPMDRLANPDVLRTLAFRHIADSVTGAVNFEPAGPAGTTFAVRDLPFRGNPAGRTCVVLAVPTAAPDSTVEVPSFPLKDRFTFTTFPFNDEQPDPSRCLGGVNAFTTMGAKLLSNVDFDSAKITGRIAPDLDDDGSPLPFSASILVDGQKSNTTRTGVADAQIIDSYDGACSRRSLSLASTATVNPVAGTSDATTIKQPYGMAIELGDSAKTALAGLFTDAEAPQVLKGVTFGFMHAPNLKVLQPAAIPATGAELAKVPVLGFGTTAGSSTERKINGIYWQERKVDSGTKQWAICLALHGRTDACASRTFANDGGLAAINSEKSFIAVTLARLPGTVDASGKVLLNLFVNGQTAVFDGPENLTVLDLRPIEATQIIGSTTTFVIGANLERTAHAEANYNAWFMLDRPLNAAEIRTVAQTIDPLIIPAKGEASATVLKQVTISVSTKGGRVTGNIIQPCEPESTVSAGFIPGSPLNLTASPRAGYKFKEWGGDCKGTSPSCSIAEIRADKDINAAFEPKVARINLAAEGGGSIELTVNGTGGLFCGANCGERSFLAGDRVKLTAVPGPGGKFNGWAQGAGTICAGSQDASQDPVCEIDFNPDTWNFESIKTAEAQFAPATYQMNVEVSSSVQVTAPDVAGSIKINGETTSSAIVTHGVPVSVAALPTAPRFRFKQWNAGGPCSGQGATCTLTPTGPVSIRAEFELSVVMVSISVAGRGVVGTTGPVAGAVFCQSETTSNCIAEVPYGTSITLTATPGDHAVFGEWTPASCGSATTCTIADVGTTVTRPAFSARFITEQVQITVARPANGTVTSSDGRIDCGPSTGEATCSSGFDYNASTDLILSADAAPGYRFSSWTGCATALPLAPNSCRVPLTAGANVSASFEKLYKLSVAVDSSLPTDKSVKATYGSSQKTIRGGQAAVMADNLAVGASKLIVISDVPAGYTCAISGAEGVMGTADATATVSCTALNYFVASTASPTAGASFATGAIASWQYGDTVTVAPVVNPHYRLKSTGRWTVSPASARTELCSDSTTTCKITITENTAVTANLEPIPYTLTLFANPAGKATLAASNPGPYTAGTQVSITPTVESGFALKNTGRWQIDPAAAATDCGDTSSVCKIAINGDTMVTVNVEPVYPLTVSTSDPTRATVAASSAGPHAAGTQVIVTANVSAGYALKATGRWTVQPASAAATTCTDDSTSCPVVINSATTVIANIEPVFKLIADVTGLPNSVSAVSITASTSRTGAPGVIDKTLFNGTGQELTGGLRAGNSFSRMTITDKPDNYSCDVAPASGTFAAADIMVNVTCREDKPTISLASNTFRFTRTTAITPVVPVLGGGSVTSCTVAPSLPAGLTMNPSTCVISGTPSALANAADYAISAGNGTGSSSAAINITVVDVAPTISLQTTNHVFTKNTAIANITPVLSGGAATSCEIAPALPAGLTINNPTCVISGTPTELRAQTSHTITVRNSGGSGNISLAITVNDIRPQISFTPAIYKGPRGTSVGNITPVLAGGSVTGCATSPALPAGLSINNSTCVISGTPTGMSPEATYNITASNTGGDATAAFSLWITDIAPVVTLTQTAYSFSVNTAITAIVPTRTGGSITSCSVSPTLPQGLSVVVMSSNCRISGTPTTTSAANTYSLNGTNDGGSSTVELRITVNDVLPVITFTPSNLDLTLGTPVPAITRTTSGGAIVNCEISPALSAGLNFDTTNCGISGTPTALQTSRSHTVTARNSGGSYTTSITIRVKDIPPVISLPGVDYVFTKNVLITPITATLSGGTLTSCEISPALSAGLVFSSTTCAITGTPIVSLAQSSYTITARNSGGNATASLQITIREPYSLALSYISSRGNVTAIVQDTPNVANCANAPLTQIPPGCNVRITATPAAAAGFTNGSWSGACSGNNSAACTITMNANASVGATFLSTDAALSSLSFRGDLCCSDTLTFATDTLVYNLKTTAPGGSISATARSNDPVTIKMKNVAGQPSLPYRTSFNPGINAFEVEVTAQDGASRRVYQLNVNKSTKFGVNIGGLGTGVTLPNISLVTTATYPALSSLQNGTTYFLEWFTGATAPVYVGVTTASLYLSASYNGPITQPPGYTCDLDRSTTAIETQIQVPITVAGQVQQVRCRENSFTLTIQKTSGPGKTPGEGGTVNSTNGLMGCGTQCPGVSGGITYSGYTLVATPSSGFQFSGWSGDCSGTGNCVLSNVTSNKTVTASFALVPTPTPVPTCGGKSYDNACWYVTDNYVTCDQYCATRGGATTKYVEYGTPVVGDTNNTLQKNRCANLGNQFINNNCPTFPGTNCLNPNSTVLGAPSSGCYIPYYGGSGQNIVWYGSSNPTQGTKGKLCSCVN